ncbi:MAG: hypothetical protein HRT71_01665 [Flavobacteriales bacterium]|nr:hypothetical protein [Flavobacteriales bacterium]
MRKNKELCHRSKTKRCAIKNTPSYVYIIAVIKLKKSYNTIMQNIRTQQHKQRAKEFTLANPFRATKVAWFATQLFINGGLPPPNPWILILIN